MRYLIFFTIAFQSFFSAFSQDYYDDFEGSGNVSSWDEDDCNLNANLSNPYKQGINTSNTVLEYNDIGGKYANIKFDGSSNFQLANYYYFKLKIYIPSSGLTGSQSNQISLKLQNGTLNEPWSSQSEIIKSVSLNTWQEVTFDFKNGNYKNLNAASPPPIQRTDFNRVILQVNGEDNNDKVIAYIDDFVYDMNTSENTDDPVYDNLVWSDEFDGSGTIDTNKWFHQTKLPAGGSWYNNEIQHYTDRNDNAYLSNGYLNIVAKKRKLFKSRSY